MRLRISLSGRVRPLVRPSLGSSVPFYFRTTNLSVFEGKKSNDIIFNDTEFNDIIINDIISNEIMS